MNLMNRRHLAILAALALLPASVMAQGHCPADSICVDYEGVVIAVDPARGSYQEIVVEERTTTIKDFTGTIRTNEKVTLLPIIEQGDGYVLGEVKVEDKSGIYADAELDDVYSLQKDQ